MPSRADVNVLVDANRAVRELIERDLFSFWESLDLSNPAAARDALEQFMPLLVAQYGDVSAVVAADWYAQQRSLARAPGKFAPSPAKPIAAEFVQRGVRSGVSGLFTDRPQDTLDLLVGKAGKWAVQAGRDTILRSASRDPWKPRVARVPSGATTCAFCLMTASRGAVYASMETAGRFNKFHGHCDCQFVVVGKNSTLPEGYDPAALHAQYQDARAVAASSGGELTILEAMRRDGDSNVADAVHDH